MSSDSLVPETRVLAIASHVSLFAHIDPALVDGTMGGVQGLTRRARLSTGTYPLLCHCTPPNALGYRPLVIHIVHPWQYELSGD